MKNLKISLSLILLLNIISLHLTITKAGAISAVDPDGTPTYIYQIVFDIDCGFWWGPFEADEICYNYWNWTEEGEFIVKAKAKDPYGAESDWAILEVTVPKSKSINEFNLWISRLIERFPIIEFLI